MRAAIARAAKARLSGMDADGNCVLRGDQIGGAPSERPLLKRFGEKREGILDGERFKRPEPT